MKDDDLMYVILIGIVLFMLFGKGRGCPCKNSATVEGYCPDYKKNTDLNKYLIPSIDDSDYDENDKEYFKKYFKLYLGFFFCLDMNKVEITQLSPFFQLPSNESKQDLIFFPTTIYEDNNQFLNISYSLGDNRSYVCKLHSEVIKTSLYDKNNIDMHMNYNVNPNYYLELLRTLRIVNKFSPSPKDFNIFVEA